MNTPDSQKLNQQPPSKEQSAATKSNAIEVPSIALPKGGGAIKGIGEKFSANPVTGTGSMSVPIALSPGRGGFGPQLSLSYDSGAGLGIFGLGWQIGLPGISRKTDKGLPKYQDSDGPESDVFILSGAEDLVPTLINSPDGHWIPENVLPRTVNGSTYHIKRYRPRIEGLFNLTHLERGARALVEQIKYLPIKCINTIAYRTQTIQQRFTHGAAQILA